MIYHHQLSTEQQLHGNMTPPRQMKYFQLTTQKTFSSSGVTGENKCGIGKIQSLQTQEMGFKDIHANESFWSCALNRIRSLVGAYPDKFVLTIEVSERPKKYHVQIR